MIKADGAGKAAEKKLVNGGAAVFTVTDNQPTLFVTQVKGQISAMNEATLKSEKAFTVIYGSKPEKVLLSESVSADPNLSFKTTDGDSSMYVAEASYKVFLSDGVNFFKVTVTVNATLEKK